MNLLADLEIAEQIFPEQISTRCRYAARLGLQSRHFEQMSLCRCTDRGIRCRVFAIPVERPMRKRNKYFNPLVVRNDAAAILRNDLELDLLVRLLFRGHLVPYFLEAFGGHRRRLPAAILLLRPALFPLLFAPFSGCLTLRALSRLLGSCRQFRYRISGRRRS